MGIGQCIDQAKISVPKRMSAIGKDLATFTEFR